MHKVDIFMLGHRDWEFERTKIIILPELRRSCPPPGTPSSRSLECGLYWFIFLQRVMFFCGNIAAGDDGVSWKFFCLIKSYMVAIWPSKELQRSTIIFFWLIIRKNLRAHAIDFYWRMLSNSKWSLNWTIMHLFHESFNKIWICARKKLAKMNHENSFF